MIKDYKTAVENIRRILENYIETHNLKSLVIGISGGIDSTACVLLAKPVCEKLHIPLIGRSMPIESNTPLEIDRAKKIGSLCTDFKEIGLTDLYRLNRDFLIGQPTNDPLIDYKIRCGNLKARMRMIKLYDLAGATKGMVLSTDNYTELLAGFWTLHGDVGDFGMIQKLWKTEVYGIVKYIAEEEYKGESCILKTLQNCMNAIPTDGLGISNSDLEQLGVDSYAKADKVLQTYMFNTKSTDHSMDTNPLIKRHLATEHKRNNPFNIEREDITNE